MRIFALILVILIHTNAWCVTDFKKTLREQVSKGHIPLGYKTARKVLFGKIYLQPDGLIQDIYCQINFTESDGVGPFKIPEHKRLNTEHAWPQTRFSKDFPHHMQKSDLFHLFPTANWANSYRGNLLFGEDERSDLIPGCPTSKRGLKSFTPPDDVKGDLARALFYFSIRYNVSIDDLEEGYLRKWHKEDPVDGFEMEKNDMVEEYQGNRNPFIDNPEILNLLEDF